jgi:formate-dependent nitrite reductase membrane component NrfD
MDTDLFLVVGIVIFALAIPSLLSAWVEGRVPRAGSIMVLIGGVLVVTALTQHARGYTFAEIPDVFFSVIGRYIN